MATKKTTPAATLRKLAQGLATQIAAHERPRFAGANMTRRRADINASHLAQAQKLRTLQTVLTRLADHHEAGTIAPELAGIRSKETINIITDYCERWPQHEEWRDALLRSGIDPLNFAAARTALLALRTPSSPAQDRTQLIRARELALVGRRIPGYFNTPFDVAHHMVDLANIGAHHVILEPSAGKGSIAEVVREACPDTTIHTCEIDADLREILGLKGFLTQASDFTVYQPSHLYDRVVMNPPFEQGQDIEHVRRAWDMLADDGVLVAITSPAWQHRTERKYTAFRAWLNHQDYSVEALPPGTFGQSDRMTNVAARLITIRKEAA